MSESELAFVLEALKMVATEGWKILPQYVVNPETGQWRHHSCSVLRDRKSLRSLRFNDGRITAHERRVSGKVNQVPKTKFVMYSRKLLRNHIFQVQEYFLKRIPSACKQRGIFSIELESWL